MQPEESRDAKYTSTTDAIAGASALERPMVVRFRSHGASFGEHTRQVGGLDWRDTVPPHVRTTADLQRSDASPFRKEVLQRLDCQEPADGKPRALPTLGGH